MLLKAEAELAKERAKSSKKVDETQTGKINEQPDLHLHQNEHEKDINLDRLTPLKDCQAANDDLDNESQLVEDLENQLKLAHRNVADLEDRCQKLMSNNESLEREVTDLMKKRNDFESEINALRQKISTITAEKDSMQTSLLEIEIAKHDGDNAKSEEVRGKDLKICALEANIETLQVTLNVRDGEIKTKKEELKQLKASHEKIVVEMSNQLDEIKSQHALLQDEHEKVVNLNSQRLMQLRDCQKANDDLNDRLDKNHTVVKDLENQLELSKEKNIDLQNRCQSLTDKNYNFEEETNKNIANIQTLTKDKLILESKLNSVMEECQLAISTNQAITQEKLDLEKSIPALLETSELVRGLRVKVADLEEDMEDKRQALRHLQMTNKSLQKEIKSKPLAPTSSSPPSSPTTPDKLEDTYPVTDVTLRYLKNVIFKFLTSPETEAKQMTRAVATLLDFTSEEEKTLYEYLEWKVSWFGVTKPKLVP